MTTVEEFRARHEQLLADAVRVLTEAARLQRPVLERDEEASTAAGQAVWKEGGRGEPADWAEFVSLALAGAAANIGGIEPVLAGRSGSWEADFVRQLLTGTVGHDGEYLLEHRTEPVTVTIYVDEILSDVGAWKSYEEADQELDRRLVGLPSAPSWQEAQQMPPLTDEQEHLLDEVEGLRDRLEAQRMVDWAAYGEAVKAAVLEAAARREGLSVPVEATVDVDTYRTDHDEPWAWGLAEQLLDEAVQAIPLPGGGVPPLERLQSAD